MTLATANIAQPANSGANTAAIVTWGTAVSALLTGAGLARTTDTGQVNWVTASPAYISSGSSSDVLIGYEVLEFVDALQATKPVVMRVEYRQSYVGVNFCYLNILPGTQTDGAGSLTGIFGITNGRLSTYGTTSCFSGSQLHFAAGDGSSLTLAIAPQTTGTAAANLGSGCFYIDRTRDASGAITGEGVVFGFAGYANTTLPVPLTSGATGTGVCLTYSFATGTTLQLGSLTSTNSGVLLPAAVYSAMSSGIAVGLQAPTVVANAKKLPPILAAVAYRSSDIAIGSIVTAQVSGSNHTYYCLGSFCACADRLPGQTGVALAMRYE